MDIKLLLNRGEYSMVHMDYIDKLELQTEEVKEVEPLEKHTIIINETFSVNKYNGHSNEFLEINGEYDDGYKQLHETVIFKELIYY